MSCSSVLPMRPPLPLLVPNTSWLYSGSLITGKPAQHCHSEGSIVRLRFGISAGTIIWQKLPDLPKPAFSAFRRPFRQEQLGAKLPKCSEKAVSVEYYKQRSAKAAPIASMSENMMSLTQVLKVDPDLVHAPGEGPAEDDRGLAVEAESLELGAALLAARRHLAHADLVAHHLHRLHALGAAPEEEEEDYVNQVVR